MFVRRPPRVRLQPYIVAMWALERETFEGAEDTRLVIPDGTVTIFFAPRGGRLTLYAAPPTSRAFETSSEPLPSLLVAARVRCGRAHRFLAPPIDGLEPDRPIVDPAWSAMSRSLAAAFANAEAAEQRLDICEEALLARLETTRHDAAAHIADTALSLLAARDSLRIDEAAHAVGISERHLRRVLRRSAGLPTKELQRIWRLRRALDEATRKRNWTEIACQTGYYDQSHMIADFRAMTGLPPTAFMDQWHYDPSALSMPRRQRG